MAHQNTRKASFQAIQSEEKPFLFVELQEGLEALGSLMGIEPAIACLECHSLSSALADNSL
mgnify:FL=1